LFSPKILESHSHLLRNEELEDLAAQLTQKQQKQEQGETVLRSIETHDLQEILAGIDRYLQRLGDIDPDWK
jgi:light-regulated signal transduction histidine kinase (bacteriophytochrome)